MIFGKFFSYLCELNSDTEINILCSDRCYLLRKFRIFFKNASNSKFHFCQSHEIKSFDPRTKRFWKTIMDCSIIEVFIFSKIFYRNLFSNFYWYLAFYKNLEYTLSVKGKYRWLNVHYSCKIFLPWFSFLKLS